MRVLYVSTEVYPALKTGGLADVNAALPPALRAAGVDVRLLLPAFPALLAAVTDASEVVRLTAPVGPTTLRLLRGTLGDVPVFLIEAGPLYDRPGNPYVDAEGRDWPDNHLRFALLGWMAARFADGSVDGWRPDIVHGHDWHAGLVPAYLAARGGDRPASVFTVHNLGFQGQFGAERFRELALPAHFFAMAGLEFYGHVNFMKAGLHYADRITTVSPTYAQEIRTPAFGFGMDGLLRSRAGALTGILNGVDYGIWHPARDRNIAATYAAGKLAGKLQCKAALRRELGLAGGAGPVFGVVSRLSEQKGLDLVLQALPELVRQGGQLALLGSGDRALETGFQAAAAQFPGMVAVRQGHDEALAHRFFAGADVMLVPSRFEPCGLTQMYAMAYGALPLVRRVGGLADTVTDADPAHLAAGTATGFCFAGANTAELGAAIDRALALWQAPAAWAGVQAQAMQQDFGWQAAAARYVSLYRELRPQA